jgi:hypothetical protein
MPSNATNIKLKIKSMLDALVTDGTLKFAFIDDMRRSAVLERDVPKFPAAILASPATDSGYSTNRENMRTYTFTIVIIQKGENMQSSEDIEELSETVLDAFDNDPTLSGLADGGMEPSSSTPEAMSTQDKSFIVFRITLKIHASKALSF